MSRKSTSSSTAYKGAGATPAPLPTAEGDPTSLPGTPTVPDEGEAVASSGVAVAVIPSRLPGYGDRPPESAPARDALRQSHLSDRPAVSRASDPVSEAVQVAYGLDSAPMHQYNCTEQGWLTTQGEPILVSRWYWHHRCVVDHPEHADGRIVEAKRALFARLGIAYVHIAPNESLTSDQLRLRVAQARAQVSSKGAATHA